MASFSPYTVPQEPAKWVNPLDLNMVYKDISYKDDIAKQNLNELQQISNQLSSLPAFGADSKMLSQKLQKLKADMSGLNLTNLGDYNTISQIKGLIGSFKNDEEVLNATQRGSFYKQEVQKKKDYEEKGKTYISPGLRKAEKYYGSNQYIKDLKFNQSGFVAPDDKELDLIAKNTPEWESVVTKGGYDVTQKGKAVDKLQANYLKHFTTNPQWSALLNDQFEQGLEGIDINQLYNSGINGIKELFPYLPKEQQQEALQEIQEAYQIQENNPYATSALKDKLRDDFFKNQAYMAAQAKTYVNTTDKKANEFSKIAVQHQNAKELVREREKSAIAKMKEKATIETVIKDPIRVARLKKASDLGYPISDPSSPDKYVSDAVLETYNLGNIKEDKSKDDTKILLGEKEYTKRNAIEGLLSGNKDITQLFVNSYKDKLPGGLEVDDEDIKIEGDNIFYEQSGGMGKVFDYDRSINKYKFIGNVFGYVDEEGNDVEGIDELTNEQIKELYNSGKIIVK